MKISSAVCVLGLGVVLGSFGLTGSAKAQADFTARRPAELLVFGGYSYTRPDYDAGHNTGVTFGADYDRSFGWRLIPGLEARVNLNSGPSVTEHTYTLGPRVHMNYWRFHPYVDFLLGAGTITYPDPYGGVQTHDGGFVTAPGAGVAVDLVRNFAVRADYHFESWNLGQNYTVKPDGSNFTLTPRTLMIGVSYRIPFKNWTDQRHESH